MPLRRFPVLLAGLGAALAVVTVIAAVVWWNGGLGTLVGRERCVVSAHGTTVTLTPEQTQQAATIAVVARRRGLPDRATTVALATALQESKLTNLMHGDRDSAGLFQQRPSQGWGSFRQVTNPRYATGKFLDALVRVPGWQQMPIDVAAQRVQRSAFPTAYQQHTRSARALTSALSGQAPAALTCTVRSSDLPAQHPGANGYTPRANRLRQAVATDFGVAMTPLDRGRAVQIHTSANHRRSQGWAVAQWLVANAGALNVAAVAYQHHVWSASRSPEGWRLVPAGSTDGGLTPAENSVQVLVG